MKYSGIIISVSSVNMKFLQYSEKSTLAVIENSADLFNTTLSKQGMPYSFCQVKFDRNWSAEIVVFLNFQHCQSASYPLAL